jgi:hypothetical protein
MNNLHILHLHGNFVVGLMHFHLPSLKYSEQLVHVGCGMVQWDDSLGLLGSMVVGHSQYVLHRNDDKGSYVAQRS